MTATARAPREHGFWVMMVLALAAGLLLQPSWVGLATALGIALALVAGAVVIGRRIRKNPALQLASTVLLGLVPAPIALVGGAEMGQTLLVAVGLAAAFTAGGLLVVSVLQRARKRFSTAAWTRWSACLLSAAATIWYLAGGHPYKAAALAVTTLYCVGVLWWCPSAKRLKAIGLSISAAHTLSVVLLTL